MVAEQVTETRQLQQDLKAVHEMVIKLDEQINVEMLNVGTWFTNLNSKVDAIKTAYDNNDAFNKQKVKEHCAALSDRLFKSEDAVSKKQSKWLSSMQSMHNIGRVCKMLTHDSLHKKDNWVS